VIEQYCTAPYFSAQYSNTEHEEKGETITWACRAPHGNALATFGHNPKNNMHSLAFHSIDDGKSWFQNLKNRQPHDMAWNCFSNRVALAFGDEQVDDYKIDLIKEFKKGAYSPTSASYENQEYYYLRTSGKVIKACFSDQELEYTLPMSLSEGRCCMNSPTGSLK
jgi:hypothetical protein